MSAPKGAVQLPLPAELSGRFIRATFVDSVEAVLSRNYVFSTDAKRVVVSPVKFLKKKSQTSSKEHERECPNPGQDGYYETETAWEKAKVHMLVALDLRLEDDAEVQRLTLSTAKDRKGVKDDMITHRTLQLEKSVKVMGFKMYEIQSADESKGKVYFNMQVSQHHKHLDVRKHCKHVHASITCSKVMVFLCVVSFFLVILVTDWCGFLDQVRQNFERKMAASGSKICP